ncbi:hypothetical protein NDU88_006800 [Pleurodeles waltl]|uniref:Uncharacterized protein n=1 Tax=Pleurodeles waltl TaxID=8319 RepID=A0AAV7UNU5_PLEWA|nr:hypothetical protein NDU88_006800 [Pleurodeles waltl]
MGSPTPALHDPALGPLPRPALRPEITSGGIFFCPRRRAEPRAPEKLRRAEFQLERNSRGRPAPRETLGDPGSGPRLPALAFPAPAAPKPALQTAPLGTPLLVLCPPGTAESTVRPPRQLQPSHGTPTGRQCLLSNQIHTAGLPEQRQGLQNLRVHLHSDKASRLLDAPRLLTSLVPALGSRARLPVPATALLTSAKVSCGWPLAGEIRRTGAAQRAQDFKKHNQHCT